MTTTRRFKRGEAITYGGAAYAVVKFNEVEGEYIVQSLADKFMRILSEDAEGIKLAP